jgi:NitT/TauT family transport system substrate-binding protein
MPGKRFKRLLGAALLGSALLAGVQALADTLVAGDQSFNNRTVMEAAGVLADLPYELEWKQFTAGSPVAEALNTGSLDVGLLGDAPPLFLGALGAPVKVIGVSTQNLDGVAILVRKDSPIHSLADLRGRSAAIWKGSWSQQLLFTALERAGVSHAEVQLRYLGALDASHALEAGAVDVIATWEPYVTQQLRNGARVLTTAEGLIPAQSFVVATDKAIATKRELLGDFLRRLQQAREWVRQDPANSEKYADTWAELTRAERDIARRWFSRTAIHVRPIDDRAVAEAQKTVDFFSRIGLIKGYPAASLFDSSFNRYLQSPPAQAAR